MQWINLKKQKPDKEGQLCLVSNKEDVGFAYWYYFDKKGFTDPRGFREKVTHWMPLPEPSKDQ